MSGYLLDTNILIYLEQPNSPFHEAVVNRFLQLTDEDELFVSILTIYELSYSLALRESAAPQYAANIREFLNQIERGFSILPLHKESALLFGQIKTAYKHSFSSSKHEQPNIKKHDIDFMLACHAHALNYTLVSNDMVFLRIQERFPNLIFENWTR